MPLSPGTRRAVEQSVSGWEAGEKAHWIEQIQRVMRGADPPLGRRELGEAVGLTGRDIGRFLSTAPRSRRAWPDRFTRTILTRLLDGKALLAVAPPPPDGELRPVMICEPAEAARLGSEWSLHNIAGGPIPTRASKVDWEDEHAWDLFGDGPPPPEPVTTSLPPRLLAAQAERPFAAVGFGAMRLSTAGRPDESVAVDVVHAALDAGITFFDSADVYAEDETDIGHNERLLGRLLAGRPEVILASKGGLVRRGKRWLPNGHPSHLRAACEASVKALGVERIELYQLHVVDRRVPIEDSVGALVELQRRGLVRHIGLCNVDLEQLTAARAVGPIVSVQNKANPFDKASLTDGVLDACRESGLTFIAHSPAGGHRGVGRVTRDPALREVAKRHETSAHTIALAWLLTLGDHLAVIPGATQPASVQASAKALSLALTDEDLSALDKRFPFAADLRRRGRFREAVVVMGIQASGKTRFVSPLVEHGYLRLNRDEQGGKLDDLVPLFESAVRAGTRRFVLDNTYPSLASRKKLLAAAARHDVPIRCVWLDTPIEEARYNAAKRMLERQGKLLGPEEIRQAGRKDPNMFPPAVLTSFAKKLEPPANSEGFDEVQRVPFLRARGADYVNKALILDYDGTLRRTKSGAVYPTDPEDIVALPGRTEVLERYRGEGYRLVGVSNQSGVSSGRLTHEQATACFERTNALLGIDIEYVFCPHPAGNPRCWCRKPLPGWGVHFIEKYRLDPAACIMIGDLRSDERFAAACGFPFVQAEKFFEDQ